MLRWDNVKRSITWYIIQIIWMAVKIFPRNVDSVGPKAKVSTGWSRFARPLESVLCQDAWGYHRWKLVVDSDQILKSTCQ